MFVVPDGQASILEQSQRDILVRLARVLAKRNVQILRDRLESLRQCLFQIIRLCVSAGRETAIELTSSISLIASSTLLGFMLELPFKRSTFRRFVMAALDAAWESSRICVRCVKEDFAARALSA